MATVYRYIREAVDLLAALVPTLQQALKRAAAKAFVILDGTLLPIDRIAADRPFYSGKHRKHGMKSSPTRSAACCGPPPHCPAPCTTSRRPAATASSTPWPRPASFAPETRATRALAAPYGCPSVANTATFQSASRPSLSPTRASVPSASWRLLRKLRCSITRITGLVQAVLALHITWV